MRCKNIPRRKSLNTKRTSTAVAGENIQTPYARANPLYFPHFPARPLLSLLLPRWRVDTGEAFPGETIWPGEEIIKIHRFENRMEKRYESGRRGVARCIGGTSSRLRVLSGHGNRCQLFFSFPPLRESVVQPFPSYPANTPLFPVSFLRPTFGLDSFGQGTHFSPFVESFLERLCGPDTTAIRATLNNTHSLACC